MALDPKTAALALHRFGFGPRAGSIAAIAADPRGAVLAELERPGIGLVAADLPSSGAANRAVFEYRAERNAKRRLEQRQQAAAAPGMEGAGDATVMQAKAEAPGARDAPAEVPVPRQIFLNEAKARTEAAVDAGIGLVERLVWFWSNHFCVNEDSTIMAGAYEREAIRPHVLGRFADMLLAAESHPAMLVYLDNAQSIGPDSVAGINRNKGINENLAREILELHTLGVGNYTQADVIAFAKTLTGWTILPPATNPDHGGEFVFLKRAHEPGPQTVLGKSYPDTGVEQARAVLADLAHHPATARHVATKLARHFVADEPPALLVERLAKRFLDTDGDLKEVTKALVTSAEAWNPQQAKVKRPAEWLIAALRATGVPVRDVPKIVGAQSLLGQPLWRPPAPKGFSDDNAAWLDGLAERLDVANTIGQRIGARLDPRAILDTALGPLASAETRQTIARAESRPQALTLLLMSPEFIRR
ncbi:MAG TPA: DUF1800 family protein [Stellaceae bacterium]|nr:DUF1800 family protein [Stellaceae bacterium]